MADRSDSVDSNAPFDDLIRAEQNRQLYDALPTTLIISALVAILLVVTHWSIRPGGILLVWLAAFSALSLLRLWLWRAYASRDRRPTSERTWYRGFWLLTLGSAMVWGSSAWLVFTLDSPHHQTLVTFVIAGLAAGAVLNHSTRWQTAWLYVLPALLPFLVRFWMLETPFSDVTAGLIAVYVAGALGMSVQMSCKSLEQIRTQLEKTRQTRQSQRQRERYRSLVESTSAITWEADPASLQLSYISPEVEKILGYPARRWIDEPGFWLDHVHAEDREWVRRSSTRAASDGQHHSLDYRMIAADQRVIWLRDVVNVVVRHGQPVKLVGVMIDISELKKTQRNLEYVSGLQQRMVDASRLFMQAPENRLDPAISTTLANLGAYCQVDRAYLIRFNSDLSAFDNTHEWCAEGISAEIAGMQGVPTDRIPEMLRRLQRREVVHLPDIQRLDEQWAREKSILMEQSIQSLLVVPVFSVDQLVGLAGFDSVRCKRSWSPGERSAMQVLGDLIGAAQGRAETDRALAESEQMRSNAESLAGMGSWEWSLEPDRFRASREWCAVTGCSQQWMSRDQVIALTPDVDAARVRKALEETLATGKPYDVEHRMVRPDNQKQIWIRVYAELIYRDSKPFKLQGFAQDISARKLTEAQLYRLAHFDSLTELPNRMLVLERLEQSLAQAVRKQARVAVFFLDLDQFKKVNDTQGHESGDRILVDASRRLVALLRSQDTIARIGGDEFLILIDDVEGPADMTHVATKILEAFRKPFEIERREFMLTASIGIAVAPEDGLTARDLMRNADTAMYHAKNEGRNGFQFFTPSMNDAVARRLRLEEELRYALERGELYLEYQPQVRLADDRFMGAEALLRWRHPVLGQVQPDEFVPVAEQTGLIDEIGHFVFVQAIAAVADWRKRFGGTLSVSVNVSPRQFRAPGLANLVIGLLRQAQLPGDALAVEITEGVLLTGKSQVQRALATLRRAGIGIVMDDFGTGYSSLSYLHDYPFNSLKIDRKFVGDLGNSLQARQLVVSAIHLGKALKMSVVAEGVETRQQRQILVDEGAELGQGFLFSPALGNARLVEMLAQPDASSFRVA
ncbi:MAG: EAL domain-containing protein [Wenzhouxiangellaceae bacterium]|nr:EAL domain-containing protein [Wenzhouxiangellaceae bacterium]